jgi:hypothetical protein
MQRGLPDLIEGATAGSWMQALLPTPTASHYGSNQSVSAGAAVRPSLASLASRRLLPAPTLADARSSANATAGCRPGHDAHSGRTMTDATRLLPTPVAAHGRRHDHQMPAGNLTLLGAALLSTPRGSDARGPAGHGGGGADLRTAIWLLPTPKASDGVKGCPAQRGSKGDLTLPSAAVRLDPGSATAAGSVPCADEPDSTAAPEPDATAPADGDPGSTSGSGHGWGPYAAAVARWESLLGRAAPPPTQPGQHGKPVLAPPFVEWLMGLDPGWVTDLGLPRTLALRVLGNGVVPQQAAVALQLLLCPYRWAVPA